MKQYRFAIILGIILFFIPFFWLMPGEMNLGGDSGRLYFYDPDAYLNLRVLYNYLGSGNGIELTYYIYLPFVVLLFLLKLIFQSPTILISFFNGLTLSVAFFSIYLILKELFKKNENGVKSIFVEFGSILGGLFYIFSQFSIYSGWEKPIIAFNQLFLNPFMAFLLLKFMLTQKIRYMIGALLITFIFTPNFSVVGAPTFFAFYPITIIFLFVYSKYICRVTFKWKFFLIGISLFFLLHTFHLISSVESVFSSGSPYNQAIFAQEGELGSRNAVSYFAAVASSVKVSKIWMTLGLQDKPYFALFIIFPLALVVSFFLNRGKTLLLTGLFFLIALYFTSALTEIGFFIYKQFFRIPGFSMFRNFNGQWLYVFIFFYSLLLGQAVAIVAHSFSKRIALSLLFIFFVVIIGSGLPLLTGEVSMPTREDTGDRHVFRMDPKFEQVLQYFRSNPLDGKVLMFPLTGFGYQFFQGKDGGVYKGLPMISYLGGKSEFGGYGTLSPLQDIFMVSMKNNDYKTLKKLISLLNIRWIFYNSDPYIYSEQFKSTYGHVLKFSPKDQKEYKAFIEGLPITKLADFGSTYHIYSVKDDVYLPHIFTTSDVRFTNKEISLMFDSEAQRDIRHTVVSVEDAMSKKDSMVIYALPKTFLTQINSNIHLHKHQPFVRRKPSDLSYHLVVLKEKFDLIRFKKNPNQYLDYALFLLSKRVEEMGSFGEKMGIDQKPWREPLFWEADRWFSYNSWNASLARYEKGVNELVDWINEPQISKEEEMYRILGVSEQLYQHEIALLRIIHGLNKKETKEKKYLLFAVNNMFERLYEKVNLPTINPSLYVYRLPAYPNREGIYEMYLEEKNLIDQKQLAIELSNQILKPPFSNVTLGDDAEMEAILTIPVLNLAKEKKWENSGVAVENVDGVTTMSLNNKLGNLTEGLSFEIPHWETGNVYLISFEHNTDGNDFIFSFIDKKPLDDSINKVNHTLFFEKRLNSKDFKTHQSIIYADPSSNSAFLKISPFFSKDEGIIQIKNLVIQKVNYPQLVFKKVISEEDKNQHLPSLMFRRINPTKYILDIKGAADPYYLVFQESFSKNWKLFDIENNTDSAKGSFSRFLGNIGKLLISPFVKDAETKSVLAASYFNGQVKEVESTNIFLEPRTFETWGKNVVSDYTHMRANEYANAWYITPSDMNGRKDYALILELKTQKKFYPAFLISLITVICMIGYSIRKFVWSKRR